MPILLTGVSGFLGQAIHAPLYQEFPVLTLGRGREALSFAI
jgi:nucleoside-diphosphate-sugar epimerase